MGKPARDWKNGMHWLLGFLLVFAAGDGWLVAEPMGAIASPSADLEPVPRIVNGIQTSRFPSTGALLSGDDPQAAVGLCSGVMIGCDTFLTAAHCVCDPNFFTGTDCQEGGFAAPLPSVFLVFLQHAGFFRIARIAVHPDFDFPVADVAVLKLEQSVSGVAPTPLTGANTPARGTTGIISGFGVTDRRANDYGIKRVGEVSLAACPQLPELDLSASVCWTFADPLGPPGTDSNTCSGDSGGPLFVRNNDFGTFTVAGVTSGGIQDNCMPRDRSYDANLFLYRDWIIAQSGADIHHTACGRLPQVGDTGTRIFTASGELTTDVRQARHRFTVPPNTARLRIAMNAVDNGVSDFDLYVKAGRQPTTTDFDCRRNGSGQFAFCQFVQPAAGPWHILVQHFAGVGLYQITGVAFDTAAIPVFCHGVVATLVGTDDDDTLTGTPGDDVIAGLGGNDLIRGLEGNDRLCGGPGNDTIYGGPGNDRLFGDEGNDDLRGGDGNDTLLGGEGNDRLRGGMGDDFLRGNAGDDMLLCGAGLDIAHGGDGTDRADPDCEAAVAVP